MLNAMIYSDVIVNIEDTDSSKRLLRLPGKIGGARVWFQDIYLFLCTLHYANTFCYV